jgi:hypothetical protein
VSFAFSAIVTKLLSCVTDESDKPREGFIASMVEIGSKQPNLVVSTIVTFVSSQGSKVYFECAYLFQPFSSLNNLTELPS